MKLNFGVVIGFLGLMLSAEAARPPDITAQGVRMVLHGEAVLTVGYLFRVYEAGLYMEEGANTTNVLGDVPKRLAIQYLRAIKADQIIGIGNDTLALQVEPKQLAELRDRIATINGWYEDVKPGYQYTLTYVPGYGSELALNGRVLGRIEGADFARAYFGIWLDPRTKYQEFRANLLNLR